MTGLTDTEHKAMALTAELWNTLCQVADHCTSRSGDLTELATHIHAIQHAVMAQAAARAHPELYRPMGGVLQPTTTEETRTDEH